MVPSDCKHNKPNSIVVTPVFNSGASLVKIGLCLECKKQVVISGTPDPDYTEAILESALSSKPTVGNEYDAAVAAARQQFDLSGVIFLRRVVRFYFVTNVCSCGTISCACVNDGEEAPLRQQVKSGDLEDYEGPSLSDLIRLPENAELLNGCDESPVSVAARKDLVKNLLGFDKKTRDRLFESTMEVLKFLIRRDRAKN